MRAFMGRREFFAAGLLVFILSCPARNADAFDLNHRSWDQVLKKNVQRGLVDYKGLKASPQALQEYLNTIGDVKESEYAAWGRADKLAIWINAYNAITLKVIIDHYPIEASFPASLRYPKNSIRQISGAWDGIKFLVMGRGMTLNDIEHETLRKQFREPRVHMALVCASLSCPVLRGEAYAGSKLETQLEDQARTFLGTPGKFKIDRDAGRVSLSPIFKWFGEDFVKAHSPVQGFSGHNPGEQAALSFISRYLDEKDAVFLLEGKYTVKYLDYDWSLNERLPHE